MIYSLISHAQIHSPGIAQQLSVNPSSYNLTVSYRNKNEMKNMSLASFLLQHLSVIRQTRSPAPRLKHEIRTMNGLSPWPSQKIFESKPTPTMSNIRELGPIPATPGGGNGSWHLPSFKLLRSSAPQIKLTLSSISLILSPIQHVYLLFPPLSFLTSLTFLCSLANTASPLIPLLCHISTFTPCFIASIICGSSRFKWQSEPSRLVALCWLLTLISLNPCLSPAPPPLLSYEGNQGAIRTADNPVNHPKMKHIAYDTTPFGTI